MNVTSAVKVVTRGALTTFTLLALAGGIMAGPAAAQASSLENNIFIPGAANDPSLVTSLQGKLGVTFHAASWYQDWSDDFDPAIANRLHGAGLLPQLIWQPQTNGTGVAFTDVTAGKYDAYLDKTAASLSSLPYTVRISLAPEFNGDWTPWGMGKNGNSPENFIAFWRYTIDHLKADGVRNVEWVWCPNVKAWNAQYTFAQMYPGDGYVTYTGLDGYNWGTSQSWSTWDSFSTVFGPSYKDLVALTGKNIQIMETASAENGGNKADWIADMFKQVRSAFPRIQGITWFNMQKEADWRIDSSSGSAIAFTQGVNGVPVATPSVTPTPKPAVQPTAQPKQVAAVSKQPAAKTVQAQTPVAVTPVPQPVATPVATAQPTPAVTPVPITLSATVVPEATTRAVVPAVRTVSTGVAGLPQAAPVTNLAALWGETLLVLLLALALRREAVAQAVHGFLVAHAYHDDTALKA